MKRTIKPIPFENEFKEFMEDINGDSKDSYITYLRAAKNKICPTIKFSFNDQEYTGEFLFDNIGLLLKKNIATRELVVRLLMLMIESDIEDVSLKYKSNIRSALRMYYAFILVIIDEEGYKIKNHDKCKNMPMPIKGEAEYILSQLEKPKETLDTYSKEMLSMIFIARILTQDRKGGTYAIELPIRTINKKIGELRKHQQQKESKPVESLRNWTKRFINNNIRFIIDKNGTKIDFSKITSLQIRKDNDVVISVKNGGKKVVKYSLYTNQYGTNLLVTFKELYNNKPENVQIRDLALDHDTAIYNILEEYQGLSPTLMKLKGNNDIALSDIEIEQLYKEFKRIHEERVSFTIMDQKENIKKGKK